MVHKFGAVTKIIITALLIALVLVACTQKDLTQAVLQQNNGYTTINGVKEPLTKQDTPAAPLVQDGAMFVPLEWLTQVMGFTSTWDNATQTVSLLKDEKTSASLTVNASEMVIGDEIVSLSTPPILQNNLTYVPLREMVNAFGWNIYTHDEAQGGLIFIDNAKKPVEPTAEQITVAQTLLGPSRRQLLLDSAIFRVDSEHAMVRNEDITLKDGEHTVSPIRIEGNTQQIFLPILSATAALGATAQRGADSSYQITTTDGTVSNILPTEITTLDAVDYISAETLAATLGLHTQLLEPDVLLLSGTDMTAFADQTAYAQAVGAQLPIKLNIPNAEFYVALTFDDGPTGKESGRTVKLLDGLKERGAHATFFMCGYRIKDFHTHMSRYLAEGHEVGNHTMNHTGVGTKQSPDKVYSEYEENNQIIKSYVGENPTVGRPVGGAYNDMVLAQMKKAGLPVINWSLDTNDWRKENRTMTHVRDAIVNNVKDGDIVLMHDLYESTVDGALAAIDILKEQGYAFVTVQELAAIKGVTLEPGKLYTKFQ